MGIMDRCGNNIYPAVIMPLFNCCSSEKVFRAFFSIGVNIGNRIFYLFLELVVPLLSWSFNSSEPLLNRDEYRE